MRLLVLGGTGHLSRLVAQEGLRRGHAVTCVTRGRRGGVPDGAQHVVWDRHEPAPEPVRTALERLAPDVVVDVATVPRTVRHALDVLGAAHWIAVSSVSVYADLTRPGGVDTVRHPALPDTERVTSAGDYGGMKAAVEDLVRERAASAAVVRPGLLGGPGDETGRLGYWTEHALAALSDGDPRLLVPADPQARVQVLDTRDLAALLLDLAQQRRTGTIDAVGPSLTWPEVVAALESGTRARLHPVGLTDDELQAADVRPWAGPRALPLWLGDPDAAGMLRWDDAPARAAGLRARPLAHTVADDVADRRATAASGGTTASTGLTRAEEIAVLDAARG